ncbi:hypothetical protein OIU84_021211 [Salix udensis]|uniref:Uncharacterized protein n=1 Tax=Salix udensis TaxID=889485 RepID=A0AAD6PGS2_9ROSI|nr:hypothetical protein OIU84_021211 [Salix udensis]
MINGSSRRNLLLNSQNFCRSIPAGAENLSLSRLSTGGSGEVGIGEHSSWGVENSDAHNAERRRQILLLTANDDEGFVVANHSRLMKLEANRSRAA